MSATEEGAITPATVIKDMPLEYSDGAWPRNDDRIYTYTRTIYSGVEDSVNAVAANTLKKIGASYGYDFAKNRFGLATLVEEDIQFASLALGAQEQGITVRDMTNAFATFANKGVRREGRTYTKVYDSKGNLVLDNIQDSEQILSEKSVNYMNYCLTNAVTYGTGYGADFSGIEIAGKTGSTSSFRDRWFCGFTGYYTAAVWCGYDTPEPIYLSNSSGNVASKLWKNVMEPLHKGLSSVSLYDTEQMVSVTVCTDTGLIATDACANDLRGSRTQQVLVYPEDVPATACDKHVLVDYCTQCGCAANAYCVLLAGKDSSITIEKKGLLKLTQSEVNEILAAAGEGLEGKYVRDNYVYLVKDDGTDGSWHGFYNSVNRSVTSPYEVCTRHTKAMWDKYDTGEGNAADTLPPYLNWMVP